MSKKMRKAAALLLAALMLMAMTACGAGSKSSEVGRYNIYEMKSEETVISLDLLKTIGMEDSYIELKDGGKAEMCLGDEEVKEFNWGDGKLTADGESVSYTITDGIMTIDFGSESISFKKAE